MDFEKILETYTLEEILECNEISQEEILKYIEYERSGLKLPAIPVDAYEKAKDGNRSPY